MDEDLSTFVYGDGRLTPWGQGQMDALARRVGWFGYPGDIPFVEKTDEGTDGLGDTSFIWLSQVSRRGGLPQPTANAGGIHAMLAQMGVTI